MFGFILTLHIIISILLILIILLQSGRAGSLGGIFGGGGTDALFSVPSGSAFLRKITASLAIAFIFTSLMLTFIGTRKTIKTVTTVIPPVQTQRR